MGDRKPPASVKRSHADRPVPKISQLGLHAQADRNVEKYHGLNASVILLLLGIYRASALLDRYQKSELAASELSTAEFNALTVLNEVDGPITMSDLGTMMAVRATNLSGIVNRLQTRKFVKQEFDDVDRRARLITLTKSGRKFLDGFLPGYWQRLGVVLADMPASEMEALVRALKPLTSALKKSTEGER